MAPARRPSGGCGAAATAAARPIVGSQPICAGIVAAAFMVHSWAVRLDGAARQTDCKLRFDCPLHCRLRRVELEQRRWKGAGNDAVRLLCLKYTHLMHVMARNLEFVSFLN